MKRHPMTRNIWIPCLIAAAMSCADATAQGQQTLTYADLVGRLTDMEHLATLPPAGERTAQWSSYDRASKYDAAGGKYIAWDANADGTGYIRKEGDQLVLAEMEGPGCIFRIWSARPWPKEGKPGRVKVYLDGAAEPAIDLTFREYFDGTVAPFDRPELCYEAAKGWNNYTPIPYARSCKIVAEENWGMYFHFNYTTFPKGTVVPTFSMKLSDKDGAALDEANRKLAPANRGIDPAGARPGQRIEKIDVTLAPGQSKIVLGLSGPRAITSIRMKTPLPEQEQVPGSFEVRNREEQLMILRELALSMTWDGAKQPQVWSPLGEFFGTTGENPYRSLPLGFTNDKQWYSLWYMPFASGAAITLSNDGKAVRRVQLEIAHAPLGRPIAELSRFHAKWHRDAFMPEGKERAIDWTMLSTRGRGRFVGAMLHAVIYGGFWWGEGDEKIFVDGENFPSTFGTGSEDYFGYAWGCGQYFERPYHAQPIETNNHGHVNLNRWHISDQIPFQTSFEAYIERYYGPRANYSMTAYWYQAPGGQDPYEPLPLDERVGYFVVWKPMRVADAIEGEHLKVLRRTGGSAVFDHDFRYRKEGLISNDRTLNWINTKDGAELDLALPVKQAGKYKLTAVMIRDRQAGIVAVSIDGKPLGKPIDLYDPVMLMPYATELGTVELTAGEHTLGLRIVGKNADATERRNVGLDYVKLEAVAAGSNSAR